jgi:hypothetical protein
MAVINVPGLPQFRTYGLRKYMLEQERFISLNSTLTPATATTVQFDYEWRTTFSGTGAAVTLTTTSQDASHVGIVDLGAGTATNSNSSLFRANLAAIWKLDSTILFRQRWAVMVPQLSNGTDEYGCRVMISDGANALPNNLMGFEYLRTASVNWRGAVRSGGGAMGYSSGGTSVPVSAGAWAYLDMIWNGTQLDFVANDTYVGSIASGFPTAALWATAQIINSAGTGAGRILRLDSCETELIVL